MGDSQPSGQRAQARDDPWYKNAHSEVLVILAGAVALGVGLDAWQNAQVLTVSLATGLSVALVMGALFLWVPSLLPRAAGYRVWLDSLGGARNLWLSVVGCLLLLWGCQGLKAVRAPRIVGTPMPPSATLTPRPLASDVGPTLSPTSHSREAHREERGRSAAVNPQDYVNPGLPRGSGSNSVGLVLVNRAEPWAPAVEAAVGRSVAEAGLHPVYALLKPSFYADGHASALMAGDWTLAGSLSLEEYVGHLLVLRAEVVFESSQLAPDLRTCRLVLEARCLQTQTGNTCGHDRLTTDGAAFTERAAEDVALRHLAPALRAFLAQAQLAPAPEQEARP